MDTKPRNRFRFSTLVILIICMLGIQLVNTTATHAQEDTQKEIRCFNTFVVGEAPADSQDKSEPPPCEPAPVTSAELQKVPGEIQANAVNLMSEKFEGAFPSGLWDAFDNDGATNGEYYWDDDNYRPYEGSWSAWAAAGGADGLDPEFSNYPNNAQSWMIYGPFDLSKSGSAYFDFYYWNDSEETYDLFSWGASGDGTTFTATTVSGYSGGWVYERFNLGPWLGDSSVWIGFEFTSDYIYTYEGPYVDWIDLWSSPIQKSYPDGIFQAKFDGWILESSENSNKGGTKNNTSKFFLVGDDALNRQYRSILSFDTSGLPDNAVITRVQVWIRRGKIVGRNPFKTHKGLWVDIRRGNFGTSAKLQLNDFQKRAHKSRVGKFTYDGDRWYRAELSPVAYQYINKAGRTQIRLRFLKDDNNDFGADYIKFYSGNAPRVNTPALEIDYYVP